MDAQARVLRRTARCAEVCARFDGWKVRIGFTADRACMDFRHVPHVRLFGSWIPHPQRQSATITGPRTIE
jgi:hypothetical protein